MSEEQKVLRPLSTQIAGHGESFLEDGDRIYKPLNKQENDFYVHVNRLNPTVVKFVPKYYGIIHSNGREV